jgi:hypothetical protein
MMDILGQYPPDTDDNVWTVVFVESETGYIYIHHLKNKTLKNLKRSPCQRGSESGTNYGREEVPTQISEESSARMIQTPRN